MSLESIHNIFPLIDDPMNIFYSKIKQWFQLNSNFHLHCKAVSRVERVVECSFNGISRTYKAKFNTTTLLKEEDIDQYLYIRFTFIAKSKETFELTTSGENIPVDISDLYIKENSPEPVVLKDQSATILYGKIPPASMSDPDEYSVYIRVNKVYRNEYSQLDIQNTEIAYDELHFEDMYHQSVGRLWVLNRRSTALTTKKSELDNNYEWKLYNIDSDNNYTLIDSSNTTPELFGATIIWPVQYGPGLDHISSFICYNKTSDSSTIHDYKEPPADLINGYSFWSMVMESDFYYGSFPSYFSVTEKAIPFLSTRGIVPSLFPYLYAGLRIKDSTPKVEDVILLLSYICNMNPRYILCGLSKDPLNQVVQSTSTDTPITLLGGGEDPNKSLNGVKTAIFNKDSSDSVTYITNTSSTAHNKDKVTSLDLGTSLTQNSLPVPIFPNVKWYYHQWIYALSFKKYLPFGTINNREGIRFKNWFQYPECLDKQFLLDNLVSI